MEGFSATEALILPLVLEWMEREWKDGVRTHQTGGLQPKPECSCRHVTEGERWWENGRCIHPSIDTMQQTNKADGRPTDDDGLAPCDQPAVSRPAGQWATLTNTRIATEIEHRTDDHSVITDKQTGGGEQIYCSSWSRRGCTWLRTLTVHGLTVAIQKQSVFLVRNRLGSANSYPQRDVRLRLVNWYQTSLGWLVHGLTTLTDYISQMRSVLTQSSQSSGSILVGREQPVKCQMHASSYSTHPHYLELNKSLCGMGKQLKVS